MTPHDRAVLTRLAESSATLAQLRAALPPDDPHSSALPSMGEDDPFGLELAALVEAGVVVDRDGWYGLRCTSSRTAPQAAP